MRGESTGAAELRALEEQNGQLLALFLASQRLASTLDLGEVQGTILDILVEFTGAAAASLWLRDEQHGDLRLCAARGLDAVSPRMVPWGVGTIGKVAAGGEQVLDPEGSTDRATGLPVLAAVPLHLGAVAVGVVAVHGLLPQKSGLDVGDQELLGLIAGQAAAALTSARLYEESQATLRGLRELGQRIAAHVADLDVVARTTVAAVAQLLRADACQLHLTDPETGDLVLRGAWGSTSGEVGARLRAGEGLVGQVLVAGRTLRLDEADGEPLGSILATPLRVADEPIGVLSVGRGTGAEGWGPAEESVLATAADQLAVGINNARLYARVEAEYFTMSTLFMAANRLHATLDLDEILRSARDILESLIGAGTYAIILLDEVSSELRIAVAEGVSPTQTAGFRASVGVGLIGQVVASGEAYIAPGGRARERAYGQPILACVPLRVEGVVVGAIVVNRLLPHKSGLISTDNELFALLAQHAATAILAARLYARAEQKLVTLYDLSRLISASVSGEEILEVTMSLVTQVLRAQGALLYELDRETNTLRLAHVAGIEGGTRTGRVRLGEGPVGQVVATGTALDSEDAGGDARFAGADQALFRGPTLVLPLRVAIGPVGALAITGKRGGAPFGADDRRLAGALAGQIALILHHIGLYQQAQHLAILLEREREALRAANRSLELANQQLDSVIEHLAEAVLVLDANGRIIRLNQYAWRLLGWTEHPTGAGDVLALDLRRPVGDRLEPEERPITRALRGERVIGLICQLVRPDGQVRDLEVSAEPLPGPDGDTALVIWTARDVTSARNLDRAKDAFIATASHELRNPLTSLLGHVQLLVRQASRSGADEAMLSRMRIVEEQTLRLSMLVERLLDASRVDLGRLHLELAATDLVALVRRAADDARAAHVERAIHVDVDPEVVEGWWDQGRIEQVMNNLLSNALKFAPADQPIEVSVRREDGHAHVEVRDRGPGVPPDQTEQIFERYAQGAEGRTHGGLGLGLHVSRRIIEAHGGRIWVASVPDGGAAFHVLLPVRPVDHPIGSTAG